MKKTNEIVFKQNRKHVLDNLPGTACDLETKLNVHCNTIYNHIKQLLLENKIHINCKVRRYPTGPLVNYYALGPNPITANLIIFKQPDKIPKRDFLTATFFSNKQSTSCRN